jgi:hypothetical protein
MRVAAAVALLLLVASAASAQPPEPGTYSFRGSLGLAKQSLGDVNDDIALDASTWGPLSSSLDWKEHGDGVPFGLEFGYQYSERWSWAFGLTWHKSTVDHAAMLDFLDTTNGVIYTGPLSESQDLKLLDMYGTAAMWIPHAPGLHLGAQLGFAMGSVDFSDGIDLDGDDGSFLVLNGDGEGHATGFSAGLYAGYEVTVTPLVGLSARVGYLQCNLGKMDGRYQVRGTSDTGPIAGQANGSLTDSNGRTMDWDFSGLRASGGVTLRFRWTGAF